MAKWEYKIVEYNPLDRFYDREIELNALGEQGWELVSVTTNFVDTNGLERLFFKRAKQ